ncbi:DUF418 domain-containing protein [Aquiflexum gelatinilyticum]|uniref:DUF418 domain-containing protein n=1 Tax=Aquiflexum gelatinilyticum TaxID=2961943 RepID=A0A9X2PBM3_9BACT|nr:DUF418 domain-containing protein [Aquiflexum gelatinilyticum]
MITQTSYAALTPIQTDERVTSLDVMRGIVLCGILIMNINGFGLAFGYNDPSVLGGDTGLNLYTWMMSNLFFEGTMRALFSLLFGVGMFIFLDRLQKKGAGINAADIYFRRISWLLVFGLIHGYLLLWVGEILYNYALMGFLVYSFRNMVPKKLMYIGLILMIVGTGWNYYDYRQDEKWFAKVEEADLALASGQELTKELNEAKDSWEKRESKTSPEATEKFIEEMQKGYFSVLAHLAPINYDFNVNEPYRGDLWDVLSMMLIGIALFKWGILSGEKSSSVYWLMVGIGYPIGIAVNYYEMKLVLDAQFSTLSFSESNLTYYWGRFFVAMGHVGLIMLFCKSPFFILLKKSLAAVGKMALTNYLMHSVICMFVFTGVGFGLFGQLERFELLYVVISIWVFQLILSPIWLKYFHFGPVEWIWRSLSYMQKPPFRKA